MCWPCLQCCSAPVPKLAEQHDDEDWAVDMEEDNDDGCVADDEGMIKLSNMRVASKNQMSVASTSSSSHGFSGSSNHGHHGHHSITALTKAVAVAQSEPCEAFEEQLSREPHKTVDFHAHSSPGKGGGGGGTLTKERLHNRSDEEDRTIRPVEAGRPGSGGGLVGTPGSIKSAGSADNLVDGDRSRDRDWDRDRDRGTSGRPVDEGHGRKYHQYYSDDSKSPQQASATGIAGADVGFTAEGAREAGADDLIETL